MHIINIHIFPLRLHYHVLRQRFFDSTFERLQEGTWSLAWFFLRHTNTHTQLFLIISSTPFGQICPPLIPLLVIGPHRLTNIRYRLPFYCLGCKTHLVRRFGMTVRTVWFSLAICRPLSFICRLLYCIRPRPGIHKLRMWILNEDDEVELKKSTTTTTASVF